MVRDFHEKHEFARGERFFPLNIAPAFESERAELENAAAAMEEPCRRLVNSSALPTQRACLIGEEAAETISALMGGSLIDLADGLADLAYVVLGTAVAYGIDLERVFACVHESNMTKPRRCDAGLKPAKGGGYSPPDIAGALAGDDS